MKQLFIFLSLFLPALVFAQSNNITGTITEQTGAAPAVNATVNLVGTNGTVTTKTDEAGKFAAQVPAGDYRIDVTVNDVTYTAGNATVKEGEVSNSTYTYSTTDTDAKAGADNQSTVTLNEDELKDDGSQTVSSVLTSSRDVFVSTAAYSLSAGRFKIRGYGNDNFTTYLNGVPVNDPEDGFIPWGQWSGLNNVMNNRETTIGLQPSSNTFGNIGGIYSFDSRAAKQRKQLQVSYTNTNRAYKHRLMATYSTGILKHGWAVSVSASRRWAAQGYVPGTFYDGYSYFLAVQKYFGSNQSLALTVLGSPTKSGVASASVMEMYNLAGSHYYNPNWGYQDGKVRNAKVSSDHEPIFILTHEWKIDNNSNWTTSAGFSFGKRAVTGLDWYNARDPRPDYYSNLPSYLEDSTLKMVAEENFREDINLRQVNWQNLYDANATNYETIDSVDGIAGNTVTGKRGVYILEKTVQSVKRFNFATTYNHTFSDHIALTAGLTYQMKMNEYYKQVDDLLGADFFVDINQFSIRDFPDSFSAGQNDLNHPNRILKEGDKYGYDYVSNVHTGGAWAQGVFKFKHVDFFAAANLSGTAFWRYGKTRVGLFPDNSYGKSATQAFFNYAFKAGITYKVDGRNYLYLNAAHETRAPYFDNVYLSPRTRNQVASDLKNEVVYSVEGGYQFISPKVKLKADMYYSQFNDETKNYAFYDGDAQTFVNYTLVGINSRHWGAEISADVKLYKGFSATGVASIGRYTYTSRPTATITQDNNMAVINNETIYMKNFNIGGTPQMAYSFGLNYRDPKFWYVGVNFNYYDWMWVSLSPPRRTVNAVAPLEPNTENWDNIIDQERLKGQFTMDLHAGYSWLLNNQFQSLKKRYFIVFSLNVTNITNNQNFIINSYEQLRFDFRNNDISKFPSKYQYAYSTTYAATIALRM